MIALSKSQKDVIKRLAEQFGAADVRLFGSYSRGAARADSDLDILVRFGGSATLIDVIGFQQALEDALGLRVDVVEEGGLSPYLNERILNEAVAL